MKIYEAEVNEDVINKLIELLTDWENENSCHGYIKNEKKDIIGNRVFLISENDLIIGYLFGKNEITKRKTSIMANNTPYFEAEELYIKPEYRSKGIGRKLFTYVEEKVKAEGLNYILLCTATKNHKAILHFYIDELDMEFWHAKLFKKL